MVIFEKYYKELGLLENADDDEIKTAYRKLVKIYHPDKSGSSETREKFIRINDAYKILSNRKEYLQILLAKHYLLRKQEEEKRKQTQEQLKTPPPRSVNKEYASFQKSFIYRSAMFLNTAFNYVFLSIGLIMIAAPVFGYFYFQEENINGDKDLFNVIPLIIGLSFFTGVWYFAFKKKEI